MTVADHGRGLRRSDWGYTSVNLVGLTNSKRFWRGDNLRTAHAMVRAGGLISAPARAVTRSRAVLDISGGDSFTDIYGAKRFQAMALSKRMALNAEVPLILLPQKLGPFQDRVNEEEAVKILRRAEAVWVRDAQSYDFLQDRLGSGFDPGKHRLGVDVAVSLPAKEPVSLANYQGKNLILLFFPAALFATTSVGAGGLLPLLASRRRFLLAAASSDAARTRSASAAGSVVRSTVVQNLASLRQ